MSETLAPGAEAARAALVGIVERTGLELSVVDRKEEDGSPVFEIEGEDAGLFGGAETVDALQFLVNRMAGRMSDGEGLPVYLDADGFRQRRREELVALAGDLADEVRETGRSTSAGRLTAYERRLVHIALEKEEGITSRSDGIGRSRRLVVEPE